MEDRYEIVDFFLIWNDVPLDFELLLQVRYLAIHLRQLGAVGFQVRVFLKLGVERLLRGSVGFPLSLEVGKEQSSAHQHCHAQHQTPLLDSRDVVEIRHSRKPFTTCPSRRSTETERPACLSHSRPHSFL